MSTILRYPKGYQYFDGNGNPLALGNLYYYAAGTTTPQDTYANSAATIPNANPIVLDGSGRLGVDVYLGPAANYKEVLTAFDAIVSPWPDDDIPGAGSAAVFTGDGGSGGSSGLVPAPAPGDALANKFLKADGTWAATPAGSGSSATNLSLMETATTVSIASSSGIGATIPAATSSLAGVLDSSRAAKIDALAAVATSGSFNDLSNRPTIPAASSTMPAMDGAASVGSSLAYARADHMHPTDGSLAPLASPAFTGNPVAPTRAAGDNSTSLATTAYIDRQFGAANGIATLDSSGKLAAAQIPASLVGAVVYQGTWNASTNTPPLAGGVGTKGAYYKVGVAGTTTIDGIGSWNVGDTIIFDGIAWDKIDGLANEVVSVAGLTGTVSASGLKTALAISANDVSGIPASLSGQNLDNIARLGIGTTDTGNAFSCKGPSALFANAGDCRVTMSKGAVGNTAAFNFQDNYSTRVQFGLLGNDNFTISTSADGSTFSNAIVATAAGAVSFPNTSGFTGDSGSGGSVGLVPAPTSGSAAAGKFLKADGTWAVPPAASGMSNPMTTVGDIIVGGASGVASRLGVGSQGQILMAASGAPAWMNASSLTLTASQISGLAAVATSGAYSALSGAPTLGSLAALSSVSNSNWSGAQLSIANGGTGQTTALAAYNALSPMTTTGDMEYYASGTGAVRLGIGSTGQVLTVSGGIPTWGGLSSAALPSSVVQNNASSNLTAGYTASSYNLGTVSSGTVTLAAANGNIQHMTNNGAFTIAPQSSPSTIALEITNGTSAGAIATSGYTKVVGSFGTTSGAVYQCISCVTYSKSALYITEVV